jgi:hypothetical protein
VCACVCVPSLLGVVHFRINQGFVNLSLVDLGSGPVLFSDSVIPYFHTQLMLRFAQLSAAVAKKSTVLTPQVVSRSFLVFNTVNPWDEHVKDNSDIEERTAKSLENKYSGKRNEIGANPYLGQRTVSAASMRLCTVYRTNIFLENIVGAPYAKLPAV